MGALLFSRGLQEADYRGTRFTSHPVDLKNSTDVLCLTQPDLIGGVHQEYLEAGADIVETNSFNANPLSMAEFELAHLTREINIAAAGVARRWGRVHAQDTRQAAVRGGQYRADEGPALVQCRQARLPPDDV